MISRQTQGNFSPTAPKLGPFVRERKEREMVCSPGPRAGAFRTLYHHCPLPLPQLPAGQQLAFCQALAVTKLLAGTGRSAPGRELAGQPFGGQDWAQLPTVVPCCCLRGARSPRALKAGAVKL